MFNAITELFLTEYFAIMASVGKFVDNRGEMFGKLSKIFLLDQAQADGLFRLCESEAVSEIVSERDYLRHQRMQKYAAMTGEYCFTDPDIDEIIRVKGNALALSAREKLSYEPQTSRNAEYSKLVTAANGGSLTALKVLGFLQCEGVFFEKNLKAGVRNLTKAANWNDCVGALALLRYSETNRVYNVSRLRLIVNGTPFEELFIKAGKAYGVKQTIDVPETRLLNRAFRSAIVKQSVYNSMSARILYGDALSIKDKERAMFSPDAGKLNMLSDLPLKLAESNVTAVDVSILKTVALKRPDEQRRIATALSNADLRANEQYRPLCLASDSRYVLDMYASAICSSRDDTHYDKIFVADLSAYDLEPSSNNVFVRSIDEDADNRFLLFFTGNIPDKTLDYVKNFVISSRRCKFHLNSPNVTLNLSSVLPICFCDKRNARLLENLFNVVYLDDVSHHELAQAVNDIIQSKKALYGVNIAVKGDVTEIFSDCDVDKAERLIDAVARDNRKQGKAVLTVAAVSEYASDNVRRIGFGG